MLLRTRPLLVSELVRVRSRKVMHIYMCDECAIIYEKLEKSRSKTGFTFCSETCKFASRKKNGKLSESAKKTNLLRYGVEHVMQQEGFSSFMRLAFKAKHGVENPMHLEHSREKRKRTHLERYGAEHTFQIPQFLEARNETWKNSNRWCSQIELRFLDELRKHFGDVEHQKWVYKWPIDYYIKDLDLYVQLDGVYWHGHKKTLEELLESKNPRDKSIYQAKLNDQEQNEWFRLRELRLLRFTDENIVSDTSKCIDLCVHFK